MEVGAGREGGVKDEPKFLTWELSGRRYHLLRWGTWDEGRRLMGKGGCNDESSLRYFKSAASGRYL